MFGVFKVWSLIRKLNDGNSDVRNEAAMALGVLGNKRAVEPLIKILYKDIWWKVRLTAAESLGKIGDSRAVAPLEEALVDYDSRIRKASAEALARLGYPAWQEIITGDAFSNSDFERLGSCKDKRAAELLITALGDNDGARENAANILAKNGEPAWKGIIKRDEDDFDRLGTCGDKRAILPLIKAWRQSPMHSSDRRRVVEALGKLKDESAVAPLKEALKDKDKFVREAAAEALKKLRDKRTATEKHPGEHRHTIKAGIGRDCPYYSNGDCVSGEGKNTGRCTLEKGSYRTSCHVYPILCSRS